MLGRGTEIPAYSGFRPGVSQLRWRSVEPAGDPAERRCRTPPHAFPATGLVEGLRDAATKSVWSTCSPSARAGARTA